MHKAGFVNIVGNPNVGKSTLNFDVAEIGIISAWGSNSFHSSTSFTSFS